jgi:hypothetical protein
MLRVHHDNVKIRNCKFRNNDGQPALVIANAKNVLVEDCIFEDITARDGTNREPLRIGEDGEESGLSLNCKVKRCIFRKNTADVEIISIKSANNTIEDCFFIDNDGNVTVRHGGLTKIHHNYFKGNNGVRIYGYGNHVEYNCFENNSARDKDRSPISLWWGNVDIDPHWVPDNNGEEGASKPSEEHPDDDNNKPEKNTIEVYARAVGTVIRGNEFKNCKNIIVDVEDRKPKKPIGTMKGHNDEDVKKFTFEKNEE